MTALAVVSLIEQGRSSSRPPRVPSSARPAADRRRRHGGAPAGAPVGDRRLPRRGYRARSDGLPMPVPVHALASTEQYLAVLDGHPTKFAPGERFADCNGGYVVLALIAERAGGTRSMSSCESASAGRPEWSTPSTCARTSFPAALRSATSRSRRLADERAPPARAGQRRRRDLHDGRRHQRALAGVLRRSHRLGELGGEMVRPHSDDAGGRRYGLGFWLHESTDVVLLVGSDTGVSFHTVHDPGTGLTQRSSRTRPTVPGRSRGISERGSPPADGAVPAARTV